MARAVGLKDIEAILARKGRHDRRHLRSGLRLLTDIPGDGEPVRRQQRYRIRLRLWLNKGQAVRWQQAWGPLGAAQFEDNGETLITEVQINRRSLINGLFYGVEGSASAGRAGLRSRRTSRMENRGVPGVIPARAVLIAEITILSAGPKI